VMETDGGCSALPKIRALGFVRKGSRREGLSDRSDQLGSRVPQMLPDVFILIDRLFLSVPPRAHEFVPMLGNCQSDDTCPVAVVPILLRL
jgi:hypothetical protein